MVFVDRPVRWQQSAVFVWIFLFIGAISIAAGNCQAYQTTPTRRAPAQKAPSAGTKQAPPASQDWMAEFKKNPELWSEVGKLVSRMQQEVQLPGARKQSQILPRLSDSTEIYVAFPNYGEALNQAHLIFKQQLKDSPRLRDWWQKSDANKSDPKFDDVLDQNYQFSQYLGDEIVGAGSYKDKNGLLVAEIKKPGLEIFLPQMYKTLSGKSAGKMQVLTPQQLGSAKTVGGDETFVLVRQDFLVIGTDLNSIRDFNTRLDCGQKRLRRHGVWQANESGLC